MDIVQNIRKIAPHFHHGRQECAHEFTRLFMDAMLKSCTFGKGKVDKYEEMTTIPYRVFGGWLRSRVTCGQCHHNSDTFDSFLDLNLEIKVIMRFHLKFLELLLKMIDKKLFLSLFFFINFDIAK